MRKKNFTGGIDSLFQNSKIETKVETTENAEIKTHTYSRTTIIVNDDSYEKIKAIAYWERKPIKDIIEKAFEYELSKYSLEKLSEIMEFYKQNNR